MQNFVQFTPTEILFGKDTHFSTGETVKKWEGHKVFLVYGGNSARESGLLDEIEKSLEKENIAYHEFGGVRPNPRLAYAQKGVKEALDFQADMILAVGGGSVIDTAKAIAIGVKNKDVDLWDIWMKKVTVTEALPTGCVLTIPAAGSEMSDSAVLTNEETGKKAGLSTPLNRLRFAIMNPELCFTLPDYQLHCGIVDIMMHTLERYFIPGEKCDITDEIAEGLLRTVIKNAKILLENKKDYRAMSELMWCGSLSHNGLTGLGREKDFSVHKLGHAIGAKYDVAHGATLSAVWKAWAYYVYENDIDRFCHYGKSVWNIPGEDKLQVAKEAIETTVRFFKELNMPVCLEDLKLGEISEEDLKALAMDATMGGTAVLCKVKELRVDDVYQIFTRAGRR